MEEIWKDVVGFEGIYQVSNIGRIKSLKRLIKNKYGKYCVRKEIMMGLGYKSGYARVTLFKNKIKFCKAAHRLVAESFIDNPENKPQVNHIDGNRINNNVNNLEWATAQENVIHAVKNGLCNFSTGEKHHLSIKVKCTHCNEEFSTITKAAKHLNVSTATLTYFLKGRFKKKYPIIKIN